MNFKFFFLILCLLFIVTTKAQVKKIVSKPKPMPPVTTEVTIQDIKPTQKVIVEKKDGDRLTGLFVAGNTDSITLDISGSKIQIPLNEIVVLRFGEETKSNQNIETKKQTSLSIEAALVYKSGDVVPVARNTFYLLDENLITIIKNADVKLPDKVGVAYETVDEKFLYAISYLNDEFISSVPELNKFKNDFFKAITPHIVQKITTDFGGKGVFNNLTPQTYYVFGIGRARSASLVWNLPVELSNEQNIVLDQNNVAINVYRSSP